MDDEIRYRAEAENAEKAAKHAGTESDRVAYLKIAEAWRALLAQKTARNARSR